jgi:hypothetical protein
LESAVCISRLLLLLLTLLLLFSYKAVYLCLWLMHLQFLLCVQLQLLHVCVLAGLLILPAAKLLLLLLLLVRRVWLLQEVLLVLHGLLIVPLLPIMRC